MQILDIDLDLFLDDIPSMAEKRPADDKYEPWTEDRVRHFLEAQCGLDRSIPRPGRLFTEHDELYWHLLDLIRQGQLRTPFEIVHADAHADMGIVGMGAMPCHNIKTKWLAKPVDDRQEPPSDPGWLNPGSWLLFGAAARWFSQIVYVHHFELNTQSIDVPLRLLRHDHGATEDFLELTHRATNEHGLIRENAPPLATEPAIPFLLRNVLDYRSTGPFDFVFLTQSPRYTPPAADYLIGVICSYIASR